jgi:hypothetical protein
MSMEFASPGVGGSGDSVTPSDLDGHLLVIEPSEHVQGIATTFGEKDAIRATVHDITAQSTHTDVLLFPGGLIGALKGRVGQRVLAVMGKGAAKPGQAAPWILTDASGVPEAVQAATAYLTGQTAASMAAPAAPAPAADPQADALAAALGNLTAAGLTK